MKPAILSLVFIMMLGGTALASGPVRLTTQWTLGPCSLAMPEDLEQAASILESRLQAWGVTAKVETSGLAILVKLPQAVTESEQAVLERIVTARGGFGLYDIIEAPADGSPPEGFEIPRWAKVPSRGRPDVFLSTGASFTALPREAPTPPAAAHSPYRHTGPSLLECSQKLNRRRDENQDSALDAGRNHSAHDMGSPSCRRGGENRAQTGAPRD